MTQWATTQGKMLSAEVILTRHRSGGRNISSYRPIVQYEYEVNGVAYTGSRPTAMDVGVVQHEADQFVAAHPAGALVTVYYDPSNPANSYLESGMGGMGKTGINLAIWIAVGTAAIVLIGACVFILFFAATFGIALLPFLR